MDETTGSKPADEDDGTKKAIGSQTDAATEGAGGNLLDLEFKKYELEKYKAESATRLGRGSLTIVIRHISLT